MSTPINLRNPHRTIHAGVLLTGGVTEILDVAPIDLVHGLSKSFIDEFPLEMIPLGLKEQALDIEFHWVNETGKTARLTSGIKMEPTDSFETCPPLDIILMGAHNLGYNPNEAELAFARKSYEHCAAFITICAGVEVPLRAGLLEGKTATCPRMMLPMLKGKAPGVKWEDKRWARDGKLWTSGALLNGLDVMRAFGTETWGGEGTLTDFLLKFGHWPERDGGYADAGHEL